MSFSSFEILGYSCICLIDTTFWVNTWRDVTLLFILFTLLFIFTWNYFMWTLKWSSVQESFFNLTELPIPLFSSNVHIYNSFLSFFLQISGLVIHSYFGQQTSLFSIYVVSFMLNLISLPEWNWFLTNVCLCPRMKPQQESLNMHHN